MKVRLKFFRISLLALSIRNDFIARDNRGCLTLSLGPQSGFKTARAPLAPLKKERERGKICSRFS